MNIIDDALVRKYFDCDMQSVEGSGERRWEIAYKVLRAMQESIKHGERYLNIQLSDVFIAEQYPGWQSQDKFHPDSLRLPDKWQTAGKHWHTCNQKCGQWEVIETPASKKCPCPGDNFIHEPSNHDPIDYEKCGFGTCSREHMSVMGRDCTCKCHSTEEKIREIASRYKSHDYQSLDCELRELVHLVKGEKNG